MARPSFPQKAAHLSYVAPLVAALVFLQVEERLSSSGAWLAVGLGLLALLLGGGIASAALSLRIAAREGRSELRLPAWLGLALNVAALVFGLVWLARHL